MRTAETIAHTGYWRIVFNIFVVIDVNIGKPFFSEMGSSISVGEGIKPPVTRVTRGHGAIEESIADASAFCNIGRMSHPQGMHSIGIWHQFTRIGDDIGKQLPLAVQRPTSVAEAIKSDFQKRLSATPAQFKRSSSLYYREEQRSLLRGEAFLINYALKFLFAAFRPGVGMGNRSLLNGKRGIDMCAV